MTVYVVVIAILAGLFTFYMGYTNGTNAIASSIATHALKPIPAILVSSASMFISPIVIILLIGNDSVARTVGSLIEESAFQNVSVNAGFIFLISSMIGALLWAVISVIMAVPNSVSHTLLGGLVGAGVIIFGFHSIDWTSVWLKVILMVFIAPILGLVFGYLFMRFFTAMCAAWPRGMKKVFRAIQSVNVVFLSMSVAANNIQKTLGIYLLAVILCSGDPTITFSSFEFSWWIIIIYSLVQCSGLFFGGERLVNAVGYKLHRLSTVQSFVAQFTTVIISLTATLTGIPIATNQVVSSSIMGVGAAEGISTVAWKQGEKMLISWTITFPVSMIFGILVALPLKALIL